MIDFYKVIKYFTKHEISEEFFRTFDDAVNWVVNDISEEKLDYLELSQKEVIDILHDTWEITGLYEITGMCFTE